MEFSKIKVDRRISTANSLPFLSIIPFLGKVLRSTASALNFPAKTNLSLSWLRSKNLMNGTARQIIKMKKITSIFLI